MHGLRRLRQPLPKNKTVQRPEDKPLGSARSTRHHADVLWLQTVLFDVAARAGAGVKAKGFQAQGPRRLFLQALQLGKGRGHGAALPCGFGPLAVALVMALTRVAVRCALAAGGTFELVVTRAVAAGG